MYEKTNYKQKKVYNLKKEAKIGAACGLLLTLVSLGYYILNKETRDVPLETLLAATIVVAPISVGICAALAYVRGYVRNCFSYKNNA